jgi:hypothetical protein
MNNFKRGESLYFKPHTGDEFIIRHKWLIHMTDGKECKIISNILPYLIVELDENKELYFNAVETDAYYYLWDWFYTKAELRDKRINQILEDE